MAFIESIQMVRRRVAIHLTPIREPAPAVAFIRNLHDSIDTLMRHKAEQGLQIACQAGCAYCCHMRVEASEPEILHIVRELKKRSEEELAALTARLKQYVSESASLPTASNGQACPFLADKLCSIYDHRPAVCRKAHSLSVTRCASLASEIPQDLGAVLHAEALIQGTMAAYVDTGMAASSHELASAILMALNEDQAEEKWFAGQFKSDKAP